MRFEEAVRRRREELGWSQYRLAKECGISRECISKMEAGSGHSPTLRVADKLCQALHMQFVIGEEGHHGRNSK